MSTPAPEEVMEACLAELGRARQNELPLSDQARRPTFQPGRGSGTNHLPQALKDRLESKWGVTIDDEEAQQMEGLELGDSRPWARSQANMYIKGHAAESAPPRLTLGSNRKTVTGITSSSSAAKPSRVIITRSHSAKQRIVSSMHHQARALPPLQVLSSWDLIAKHDAKTSPPSIPAGSQDRNSKKHIGDPVPVKSKPSSSSIATSQSQEYTIMEGSCELVDEVGDVISAIGFIIIVHLQKDEASLVLTKLDKDQRVHDLLTLDDPVVRGPVCLISNSRQEHMYRMKFQSLKEAQEFQHVLGSLRQSAIEGRESTPASSESTQVPTAAKVSIAKESARVISLAQQQPAGENLIDVDDVYPQPMLSIEAAADYMQNLVQKILCTMVKPGVQFSEQEMEEVESAAVAHWMAEGFMQSKAKSDDMKEELADLLMLLVRIKRKAQSRSGSKAPPISKATLKDLQEMVEMEEKPRTRIQYTAKEIQQLEAHAVSRRATIEASGLFKLVGRSSSKARSNAPAKAPVKCAIQGSVKGPVKGPVTEPVTEPVKSPAKPLIPELAAHKDWATYILEPAQYGVEMLTGGPRPDGAKTATLEGGWGFSSEVPSEQPPKAISATARAVGKKTGGLATSRWATGEASQTAPAVPFKLTATAPEFMPTPPQRKKTGLQGLSSSRWADMPTVEFEGSFAGF